MMTLMFCGRSNLICVTHRMRAETPGWNMQSESLISLDYYVLRLSCMSRVNMRSSR
jgi:hypothetical protein